MVREVTKLVLTVCHVRLEGSPSFHGEDVGKKSFCSSGVKLASSAGFQQDSCGSSGQRMYTWYIRRLCRGFGLERLQTASRTICTGKAKLAPWLGHIQPANTTTAKPLSQMLHRKKSKRHGNKKSPRTCRGHRECRGHPIEIPNNPDNLGRMLAFLLRADAADIHPRGQVIICCTQCVFFLADIFGHLVHIREVRKCPFKKYYYFHS